MPEHFLFSRVPSENLIRWIRSRKENRIMIETDGDLLQTFARRRRLAGVRTALPGIRAWVDSLSSARRACIRPGWTDFVSASRRLPM